MKSTASAMVYIFGVWALLAAVSLAISRHLRPELAGQNCTSQLWDEDLDSLDHCPSDRSTSSPSLAAPDAGQAGPSSRSSSSESRAIFGAPRRWRSRTTQHHVLSLVALARGSAGL